MSQVSRAGVRSMRGPCLAAWPPRRVEASKGESRARSGFRPGCDSSGQWPGADPRGDLSCVLVVGDEPGCLIVCCVARLDLMGEGERPPSLGELPESQEDHAPIEMDEREEGRGDGGSPR